MLQCEQPFYCCASTSVNHICDKITHNVHTAAQGEIGIKVLTSYPEAETVLMLVVLNDS